MLPTLADYGSLAKQTVPSCTARRRYPNSLHPNQVPRLRHFWPSRVAESFPLFPLQFSDLLPQAASARIRAPVGPAGPAPSRSVPEADLVQITPNSLPIPSDPLASQQSLDPVDMLGSFLLQALLAPDAWRQTGCRLSSASTLGTRTTCQTLRSPPWYRISMVTSLVASIRSVLARLRRLLTSMLEESTIRFSIPA